MRRVIAAVLGAMDARVCRFANQTNDDPDDDWDDYGYHPSTTQPTKEKP